MKIIKINQLSQKHEKQAGIFAPKGYPYYIAQFQEGRLKGQYPPHIRHIRDLRDRWDKGDFGSGKTMKEITNTNPMQVVRDVINRHEDPRTVDYYVVDNPGSPRRKINYSEFRRMINVA